MVDLADIVNTPQDGGTGDTLYAMASKINANNALIEAALNSASINVITGTSYTILASDTSKVLVFTNAAAIAVTLPDGLSTNFQCTIVQAGAGVPTITPVTDTVNGAGTGVSPSAQWKALYLAQFLATEWMAVG